MIKTNNLEQTLRQLLDYNGYQDYSLILNGHVLNLNQKVKDYFKLHSNTPLHGNLISSNDLSNFYRGY